ncbi:MAG: hypothetical protein DBX55_05500 [Verrucomicrobia bacterium]|nr:MAG: hypothetical protein DBX55_05500 [Verrucomicrobiota bacterium]
MTAELTADWQGNWRRCEIGAEFETGTARAGGQFWIWGHGEELRAEGRITGSLADFPPVRDALF